MDEIDKKLNEIMEEDIIKKTLKIIENVTFSI